jgi:hypothetical protein
MIVVCPAPCPLLLGLSSRWRRRHRHRRRELIEQNVALIIRKRTQLLAEGPVFSQSGGRDPRSFTDHKESCYRIRGADACGNWRRNFGNRSGWCIRCTGTLPAVGVLQRSHKLLGFIPCRTFRILAFEQTTESTRRVNRTAQDFQLRRSSSAS